MATVRTILLVENDPVTLEMYLNRLQREGFYVATAQDGRAALKILMEAAVDLVILDLMLSKLNGAEVLNYMRQIPALEEIPVIVFSNAPEAALAEETMARGPTKRLFKSECTFPTLLETIHGMLGPAGRTDGAAYVSGTTGSADSARTTGNGRADASAGSNGDTAIGKNLEAIGQFLKNAQVEMPKIREHCFAYIRAPGSPSTLQHLLGFHQRVRSIGADASRLGCARISILMNAMDSMLSEMTVKRSSATPSMLQTTAQAVDCMSLLLKSDGAALAEPFPKISVLTVDDDAVCNRVMGSTLKRANFDAASTDSPYSALKLLEINQYDLVLLDINMPGLTGFDVCNKLRRLPRYETTPVIFITAHNDFENRKQSVLSGGNDFIPKPIVAAELVLKMTVHLLNRQAKRRAAPSADADVVVDDSQRSTVTANSNPPSQTAKSETPVEASVGKQRKGASSTNERPQVACSCVDNANSISETAAVPAPAKLPGNPETQTVMSANTLPSATRSENVKSPAVATPGPAPARADHKAANAVQPGDELTALRRERDVLRSKLASEQQGTAKLRQDLAGIRSQLRQNVLELGRQKANLQKQSVELTAAKQAAEQAQRAFKEKEVLFGQLSEKVTRFQRERDELQGKLAAELQETGKSRKDVEALQQKKAELERISADLQHKCAEQARSISEAREQLSAANRTLERTQAALKEKETQCSQVDRDLSARQQEVTELRGKLAAQAKAAADTSREIEELQRVRQQNVGELERLKGEFEQQAVDHAKSETELREQLKAAGEVAAQTQKTLDEKETQCRRSTEEAAGLQQECDELRGKLAAEQQASVASSREIKTLQESQQQHTGELESLKAELQRVSAEQELSNSELREELNAANELSAQAQKVLDEKESRCRQLDEEITGLRQECDELRGKFAAEQQVSLEVSGELESLQETLQQRSVEHKSMKADLERALAERERMESEWREQLNDANETVARAQKVLEEKEVQCRQLDEEVTGLRQECEGLRDKFIAEQQLTLDVSRQMESLEEIVEQKTGELESVRADLQRTSAERERLESEWHRQLTAANEIAAQAQKVLDEKETRGRQLDQEVASLRQDCDELRGKLLAEEQVSAKFRPDMDALQQVLQLRTGELESTKAELQRMFAERERSESELRDQQNTANELAAQAQKVLDEKETRGRQLNQEVASLRQDCDELRGKLLAEEQVSAKFRPDMDALQQVLQLRTGELESAKAELQRMFTERERTESELREQLNTANELAAQTQKTLDDKEARCRQLDQETVGLQQDCGELHRELVTEQQVSAKSRQELEALQWVLQQKSGELETARAELQRVLAGQERSEAELREQLNAAKETAAQAQRAFEEREKRCRQLDDDGVALRQECGDLRCQVVTEQQVAVKSRQEVEALQWVLQERTGEVESIKADLQRVTAERERSESELREQLKTARESIAHGLEIISEKEGRCSQLSEEIAALQQLCAELERKLAPEPRATPPQFDDPNQVRFEMDSAAGISESVDAVAEQGSAEPTRSESEHCDPPETDNVPGAKQCPAESTMEAPTNVDIARSQTFRLTAPSASTVLLAGDFTDWDRQAIPMTNEVDGVWTATVDLAPGTYQYRFVIDGEWRPDPECELRAPNPFGGHDSVRHVV